MASTKEKIKNKAIHFYKNDNRLHEHTTDRKRIFDKKPPQHVEAVEEKEGYSVVALAKKSKVEEKT